MTPPVVRRPELRLAGSALLVALGVWLGAEIVLGALLSALGVSVPRDEALFSLWLESGQLVAYAALAAATLWGARRTPDARACLGLVRPASAGRAAGLVATAWVSLLIVEAALEPVLHGGESQGLKPTAVPREPSAYAGVAVGALAVVVAAPVVEELFFRGAAFAWARPRFGATWTAIGTAAVFAAFHLEPRAFPVLALVGFANAILYEKTGSLFPCIALHALFNGPAFLLAFLSP